MFPELFIVGPVKATPKAHVEQGVVFSRQIERDFLYHFIGVGKGCGIALDTVLGLDLIYRFNNVVDVALHIDLLSENLGRLVSGQERQGKRKAPIRRIELMAVFPDREVRMLVEAHPVGELKGGLSVVDELVVLVQNHGGKSSVNLMLPYFTTKPA